MRKQRWVGANGRSPLQKNRRIKKPKITIKKQKNILIRRKYKEAIKYIDKAIIANNQNKEYLQLKSQINKAIDDKKVNDQKIKEAKKSLSKAKRLFKNKDYEKAKEQISQSLSSDPLNNEAVVMDEKIDLGLKREKDKEIRKQEALDFLTESLNLYENKKYEQSIEKALEASRLDDAVRVKAEGYVKRAQLKSNEQKSEELYTQAVKDFTDKEYLQAKAKLNDALQYDKKNEKIKTYLKETEKKINEAQGEKEKIKQSKQIFIKAKNSYLKKDYHKAKEEANKALEFDPNNDRAEELLENIYGKEDKIKDLKKRQEKAKLVYETGLDNFRDQEYATAIENFKAAIDLTPENKQYKTSLQKAKKSLKEKQKAEKNKEKIENRYDQALGHLSREEYKDAIWDLKQVVDLDPSNKEAKESLYQVNTLLENKTEKIKAQKELEGKAFRAIKGTDKNGLQRLLDTIDDKNVAEGQLSLEECVDIALENHVQLSIAEKQIKLAKIKILEAKRNLGPSLKGKWDEYGGKTASGLNAQRYTGRKISVEYKQPLFHGGQLWYGLKQAKVNLELVQKDYERIKNNVIIQVEKAYYGYDKAKRIVLIQNSIYDKVDKLKDIAQKGFELKVIDKIENLNVQSQFNQINFQYMSSKEDVILAQLVLQQAMNTDEPIDVDPVEDPRILDISLGTCYDLSLMNRPEMKVNYLMTEYYMYDKQIAQAKNLPKVDALGSWGYKAENFHERTDSQVLHHFLPEWYAGIKVSVPFFGSEIGYTYTKEVWQPQVSALNYGSEAISNTITFDLLNQFPVWNEQVEADIGFSRAQHEYNNIKKEIALEVKEAYFKYKKALVQMGLAKSKLEYQSKQVQFLVAQNKLNQAPLSKVIEEMLKLSEEEYSQVQSVNDYYVSIKSINKAIGIINYFDPEIRLV